MPLQLLRACVCNWWWCPQQRWPWVQRYSSSTRWNGLRPGLGSCHAGVSQTALSQVRGIVSFWKEQWTSGDDLCFMQQHNHLKTVLVGNTQLLLVSYAYFLGSALFLFWWHCMKLLVSLRSMHNLLNWFSLTFFALLYTLSVIAYCQKQRSFFLPINMRS